MVGNDTAEDLSALELGLDVYLVTDCLINNGGRDISGIKHGSFAEFLNFAEL